MNPIPLSLKYNKSKGYILLELMLSIVVYSIIISTMLNQYQKFHQLTFSISLKLTNLNNLQKAMLMITEDISRCGSFGVYNLHYLQNPKQEVQYELCDLNKFISGQGLYSKENFIAIAYGLNIGPYIKSISSNKTLEKSQEASFFYNQQDTNSKIILLSDYKTLYSCFINDLNPRIINNKLITITLGDNCYINSYLQASTLNIMNLSIKNYFLKENNLYYQEISPNCQSYNTAEILAEHIKTISVYYYAIDSNNHILISKNNSALATSFKILGVYLSISDQTNNLLDSFIPF